MDIALAELERPLTRKMRDLGWTDETRSSMIEFLSDWKREIGRAGAPTRGHFKVIARWFDDLDIDAFGVAVRIIKIDNQIYDCTEDYGSLST